MCKFGKFFDAQARVEEGFVVKAKAKARRNWASSRKVWEARENNDQEKGYHMFCPKSAYVGINFGPPNRTTKIGLCAQRISGSSREICLHDWWLFYQLQMFLELSVGCATVINVVITHSN
jgi:hypothetical protein